MRTLLFLFVLGIAAHAQQREFGFLGGVGLSKGIGIQGASSVKAGFAPGVAAGAFIGHDLYNHWSGEIRYVVGLQSARLRAGSDSTSFAAQTHAVHYDLVVHSRPRRNHVRPYLAAGVGVKVYRGTGEETAYRPLMQYGLLTRTDEWKPMLSMGGGIKFRLGESIVARIDFRDQLTRFPSKVIAPASGMAIGGWMHTLVPAFGVSWVF
jgi:hypothetical protein